MAVALGLPFLGPLAAAFFVTALATWTLVFIGLARELWTGIVRDLIGKGGCGPSQA
jgi:hypothetical protein